MSHDDNKTDQTPPQPGSEESARQSPVIERDVAADPSRSSSAPNEESAPASPVKKISEGGTASSPPQKGVVLQSNQTVEGAEKEQGAEAPVNAEEDDEDDIGVFLEEIFPDEDGSFPSFPLTGKSAEAPSQQAPPRLNLSSKMKVDEDASEASPEQKEEDGDRPFIEPLEIVEEPIETATQEGFWTADDAPSTQGLPIASEEVAAPLDDPEARAKNVVDEVDEEPITEQNDPAVDDGADESSGELDAIDARPPREGATLVSEEEEEEEEEEIDEAPVLAEEPEQGEEPVLEEASAVEPDEVVEEEAEPEEQGVSVSLDEAREDGFVPTPAVAIGETASPAAPLFAENIPLTEEDVRERLDHVGQLARRCHMTSLAREIYQERIPTLQGRRITLVVLGEFNHGKSTVINALLGDEVLPMGITPTTAVITHLVHASDPIVTVQPPHHGKPYTIAYDEMEQAVKESGEEGEEPEYVEIGYPNEVLKESLVLVDTPGVNDISRQKVEITYGYLPRADVIVYVLDATQVLKKSEVVFIKDRLLKSSSDRIIFVLNKIDALSPEDVEEVVEYARERLQAILGHVELFTFSGRKALTAQKRGEPLPQDFVDFRSYLQRFVQEQRAYIILDSALAGGQRVASLMQQNLAIKRQGYSLEKADLEQRITAVRARLKESRRLIAENTQLIDSRVQGIAATAKHNLRIFTEQFSEQLPMQIERAEAGDVKKFLPTWIQETYKEWLEKEGKALARSLEELAEEVIQITNESLQKTVQSYQEEFGLNGELDLEVDTVAYDMSVFALGAFGVSVLLFANVIVGSLLTIATPVLAYFFKEKVETRVKERAREQGAKAIEEASTKLEEELLRVIHGYGTRLKEFVEMAGDRLYRQIEEALEQVQTETAGEDVDRATLLTQVELHLKEVKSLQVELLDARKELEAWAVDHYKLG